MWTIPAALAGAAIALAFAGLAWFILVRPVPERTARGTIMGRHFLPAERVEKSIPRTTRSLEAYPRRIEYNLPDRNLFDIRLDGSGAVVRYAADANATRDVEVGRPVRVVYIERIIPLVGKRIYVKELILDEVH
jgi:hypothetical protein